MSHPADGRVTLQLPVIPRNILVAPKGQIKDDGCKSYGNYFPQYA